MIYDVLLNYTDLTYNIFGQNKYCVIQLLHITEKARKLHKQENLPAFLLIVKAARIGDYQVDCQRNSFYKAKPAIQSFIYEFESRTKTSWKVIMIIIVIIVAIIII